MTSLRRVVSVLFSPGKTFQEIAERPTWAVVLVVLLAFGAASSAVVVSKIDPALQEQAIRDQLEGSRGLSGAELDRATDQAMDVMAKTRPFWPVIGVIVMVAVYLLATLLLWGGVTLAGGERIGFVKAFSTTLHGLVPQAVLALVAIPVLLLNPGSLDPEAARSGSVLASNLAVFAPEGTSTVVLSLLSSVDFFSLWSLILLIVGFSVTAKISKSASSAVVIGCWVLSVAIKVGLAALQG